MTCRAANPRDCAADELKVEIDRLRRERDSWEREAKMNQEAADQSATYAKELAEALAWIANARHHDSCNVVRGDEKCICGRNALLAENGGER